MADVWHNWGGDLEWSATGDLRQTEGSEEGRQRVLRRLLTVEGAYLWDSGYGAGLPLIVGEPDGASLAEARSRRQMLMERAVADDPTPTVSARGDAQGLVILNIGYHDADTGESVAIGLTLQE